MVKKMLFIIVVLVYFSKLSLAAEHPGMKQMEHPGKTPKAAEHPSEAIMLSGEQIIKGIKGHISKIKTDNNGDFPLYDPKDNKSLRLKLIKVHEDKVSYIKKEKSYFACTDFITDDGKTKYDVDFWMKEGKDKKLKVYQTKIHKKDGIPRFTYNADDMVSVDSGHKMSEGH